MQRTGAVRRRHDQRSLVATGDASIEAPKHNEACGVVRFVLDVGDEDRHTETLGGSLASDGRSTVFLHGHFCCLRIAADGNARHIRQISVQPFVALRQRLGVRVDLGHLVERGFAGHQVLVDAQHDLAADLQRRRKEQIHAAANSAFSRVLDRHHGIVCVTGLDFAEDIVD